jgi:hypothetical protein
MAKLTDLQIVEQRGAARATFYVLKGHRQSYESATAHARIRN